MAGVIYELNFDCPPKLKENIIMKNSIETESLPLSFSGRSAAIIFY